MMSSMIIARRFGLLAGIIAVLFFVAGAVAEEAAPTAKDLSKELGALMEARDQGLMQMQQMRGDGTENIEKELEDIDKKIVAYGEAAIPYILEHLKRNPQSQRSLKVSLMFTLGDIPGEKVDRLLIQMLCTDDWKSYRSYVLLQISRRMRRYGALTFPLTEEELSFFINEVKQSNIFDAGSIMTFLSRCEQNDAARRMQPGIDKFIEAIKYQGEYPRYGGSSVSDRVSMLHAYVIAFHEIGKPCWPALQDHLRKATAEKDSEMKKWCSLALGYAGDPSVADAVKEIVLHDADCYIRWEAVGAYANSAKAEAIPVLKELLNDKTVSKYTNFPEPFIARNAESYIRQIELGRIGGVPKGATKE